MERVLVTGAGGYVGSVLVPLLLTEGYRVRALDRFRHRSPGLLECCGHPYFEAVRGDVRHLDTMAKSLCDVDWIIPLAALVGAPACDEDRVSAWGINFGAVCDLLKLRGDKDQRIIFPTTNSGYGKKEEICTEDTDQNPISVYGQTKVMAEERVLLAGDSISFRFATAFGASPRMRTDLLVNDFVLRAVRDRCVVLYQAHFRRNYIHVQDMARVFLHAMKHWNIMKGEAYNVGLPGSYTKRELCQEIKKALPDFQWFEAEVGKDPDQRDYTISNDRIHSTGFCCNIPLAAGILELVKAYQMFPGPEFTNL